MMRAAVSEAICIDSLLPVLRHLLGLGMEEVQESGQESSASSLAMKEVRVPFLLAHTLPLLHMPTYFMRLLMFNFRCIHCFDLNR